MAYQFFFLISYIFVKNEITKILFYYMRNLACHPFFYSSCFIKKSSNHCSCEIPIKTHMNHFINLTKILIWEIIALYDPVQLPPSLQCNHTAKNEFICTGQSSVPITQCVLDLARIMHKIQVVYIYVIYSLVNLVVWNQMDRRVLRSILQGQLQSRHTLLVHHGPWT